MVINFSQRKNHHPFLQFVVNLMFWCISTLGCCNEALISTPDSSLDVRLGVSLNQRVQALRLGHNFSCAVIEGKVECWGNIHNALIKKMPHLSEVLDLYFFSDSGCSLHHQYVRCWNSSGEISVPSLVNPKQLSPFFKHPNFNCAIDDIGMRCWDHLGQDKGYILGFENTVMTTAGDNFGCRLDTNHRVECMGTKNDYGQINVPNLNFPKKIMSYLDFTCALDDSQLSCWGNNANQQSEPPIFSNVIDFVVMWQSGCAITENTMQCWGLPKRLSIYPYFIENPTQIAQGQDHVCALGENGIVCWGDNGYGQLDVPYL